MLLIYAFDQLSQKYIFTGMKQILFKNKQYQLFTFFHIIYQNMIQQANSTAISSCSTYKLLLNQLSNQENSNAKHLLQHAKQYLEGISTKYHILTQLQLQQLPLPTCLSDNIIYFCDFGCAIILEKSSIQQPITITVAFPTGWQLGSDASQQILFPKNPSQFSDLRVGEIDLLCKNLQLVKKEFWEMMRIIINDTKHEKQKKKNHHTPSWIFQVAKEALVQFKKKSKNNRQGQIRQEVQIFSKGGTLDVGNHTGITKTSTVWPVVLSIIKYYIPQNRLFNAFITSYRLHLLDEALKAKEAGIDEMRLQIEKIKKIHKKQIFYDEQRLKKLFIQFKGYMKERQVHHVFSLKNVELPSKLNQFTVQKICDYEEGNSQKKNVVLDLGQSPEIVISPTTPFSSLVGFFGTVNNLRWMMEAQNVFFKLAQKLGRQKIGVKIEVSQIEVQKKGKESALQKCLIIYERIIFNEKIKFGMNVKNQAQCHFHLIKIIGAIVAFQIIKEMRKNKKLSNLEIYRVPFNQTKQFYSKFVSLSFDAREAMESVYWYFQQNEQKRPIFVFEKKDNSFCQWIWEVSEDTPQMKNWLEQEMQKVVLLQKQVQKEIEGFWKMVDIEKRKIREIQKQRCTCGKQEIKSKKGNYYPKKIICQRCQNLRGAKIQENDLMEKEGSYKIAKIPKHNPFSYCFFYNIPPQIEGMMKIFYFLQERSGEKNKMQRNQKNTFTAQYGNLVPFSEEPEIQKFRYSLYQPYQGSTLISYPSDRTLIKWKNNFQNPYFDEGMFQFETTNKIMKLFASSPLENQKQIRQHQIYSSYDESPKDLSFEQFRCLGEIRVTQRTQLSLLSQHLLQRKIPVNLMINNEFIWNIVTQTVSSLDSLKSIENKEKKTFQIETMTAHTLQQLLQSYHNSWNHSQVFSLPCIGPILSLLSMYRMNEYEAESSMKLAQFAYQEINKLKVDLMNEENHQEEIKQKIGFICFGGLCCFTEKIQSSIACYYFLFFIIYGKASQVSLLSNERQVSYVDLIEKFKIFEERAKFMNIENSCQYVKKNPQKLTQILSFIDESVCGEIKWQNEKGYIFKGQNSTSDIYHVNIQNGIVLKNGKELTGLPFSIRNHKTFNKIFGNRDFEVFPISNGYLQTKTAFSSLSHGDKKTFFAFKNHNVDEIKVRMICKTKNGEQIWNLVQNSFFQSAQFSIPTLFLSQYICWNCQEQRTFMFTKEKIENLNEIGLTIKYNEQGKIENVFFNTKKTHQQVKNEELDCLNLCEKKLSISQKREKNSIYKIITKLECSKYIFEIRKSNKFYFFLHRYSLTFFYEPQSGLFLEGYFGYRVSENYISIPGCPWFNNQNFCCLVLQKIENSQSTSQFLSQSKQKILLPNLKVKENGKFVFPNEASTKIQVFQYNVHDHFGDIRGATREAQLHLAAVIISLDYKKRVNNISLNTEEYGMKLIRSCFGNRPLELKEKQKLKNIMELGINLKRPNICLLCEALFKTSQELCEILPFGKVQNCDLKNREIEDYLNLAKRDYSQNLLNYSESEKLNYKQLNFLSIKKDKLEKKFYSESGQWVESYGSSILVREQQVQDISQCFVQIKKQWSGFLSHLIDSKKEQTEEAKNLFLNPEGEKYPMMKEMLEDLCESYHCYQKDCQSYQTFQINKNKCEVTIKNFKTNWFAHRQKISQVIEKIQFQDQENLDAIIGLNPILSPAYYTQVLLQGWKYLKQFYPKIDEDNANKIIKLIKLWMIDSIQIDSCERLAGIISAQVIDKIALRRQCESPRDSIEQKDYWLCFQVEMRIKIWRSQFQTYSHLTEGENRKVTQLNMGEGKTQVIIPMIVLNQIYEKREVPRINLLSSLFEEARSNYFRLFSITNFNLPCIQIPFNRQVKLSEENIRKISRNIRSFLPEAFILVDRESSLSIILKLRENQSLCSENDLQISSFLKNKENWLFGQNLIFDIFDEVDALMSPKKSFIYAIGNSSSLPSFYIRLEISRVFLEIICKNFLKQLLKDGLISVESLEEIPKGEKDGKYPKIRFIADSPKEKIVSFRKKLVQTFFSQQIPELAFFSKLLTGQKQILINYLVFEEVSQQSIEFLPIPKDIHEQIYAVRGLVAYGILEHCLSLRCGVDFGVPGDEHPKKVAVPYEAADIPSKRSQYAHPDVAAILSYISYYNKGLTQSQFEKCLRKLMSLTESAKKFSFDQWRSELNYEQMDLIDSDVNNINIDSFSEFKKLYEVFRFSRATIAFWLNKQVFPQDLRQHNLTITSSSWDIAETRKSVGFSGTKDTRWLFPAQLKWSPNSSLQIRGTDGKMIDLLLKFSLKIVKIQPPNEKGEFLWKNFCTQALEENSSCLIDAGAILVGRSLKNQIIPWFSKNSSFIAKFKGITFPNDNGKWEVYDCFNHTFIERGTSIPEHETFIIFDEARTRGADLKMGSQIIAAISLSPDMTKDKLMQAVGRLRKFGRNQKLKIFMNQEIQSKICFKNEEKVEEKTMKIIQWVTENSIKENKNLLYPYSKLGWLFAESVHLQENNQISVQQFCAELNQMYSKALLEQTPENLQEMQFMKCEDKVKKKNIIVYLNNWMKKYGNSFLIKSKNFDDICERQVEVMTEEYQEEKEKEFAPLLPMKEIDELKIEQMRHITTIPYSFCKQLKCSFNFRNCTNQSGKNVNNSSKKSNKFNELMYINFVLISENSVCFITLQQVNQLLNENVLFYNPKTFKGKVPKRCIARLFDLSFDSPIIQEYQLQRALIEMWFFNGEHNFAGKNKGDQSPFNLLKKSLSKTRKLVCYEEKLQELVGHFLIRRKVYEDRYFKSSIEDIVIHLRNNA